MEDLQNGDEIFHTLYDLGDRMQIPGEQYVNTGRTYEKDGYRAEVARHPRRQGPDHGRDLPQHAPGRCLGMGGHAEYPEGFSSMAFRVGINYIIYGMTH